MDIEKLQAEAIASGYKDEVCSRCGTEFKAYIHFIRCQVRPCPMIGENSKSILQMMSEDL